MKTGPAFEAFLARLYTDEQFRERFLVDPEAEASSAGLTPEEVTALAGIDRLGLRLACDSLQRKRSAH